MAVTERPADLPTARGSRPRSRPSSRCPPELRDSDDILQVNFGPNHPSTHGVLRLVVDLYGERVVGLRAVIGYLHTGFEKNMEQKTWWKAITYPERIDYVSFQNNELVFVLAIEKLLELEVPPKATWMRTLLSELNADPLAPRSSSGRAALELGAISMFWYCFRERDQILDLFEMVCGTRMHTRYFQAGGLAEDIPRGFYPECRKFVEWMPAGDRRVRGDARRATRSGSSARRASGCSRPRTRSRSASPGRCCARPASTGICGATRPYLAYPQVDFDVPVYPNGDVYDRYQRADGRDAPVDADRRAVPRRRCPRGRGSRTTARSCCRRATSCTRRWSRSSTTSRSSPRATGCPRARCTSRSSPREASSGCYVVSDGGPKPWRVKFRAPSFVALEATATCMSDALIADLIAIVGSLDTVMGEVDR